MASAFSHAVAALSIGTCFYRPETPKRVWAAGALCSILPDIDVIGFRLGIPYGGFWGHRGFTHSLLFAVLLSGTAAEILRRRKNLGIGQFALFGYLSIATASHGVLDAMTNGGLGCVFLAVRQPPLFPAVEAYSGFAHFSSSLLQRARIRRTPKRIAVDLGSRICVCGCRAGMEIGEVGRCAGPNWLTRCPLKTIPKPQIRLAHESGNVGFVYLLRQLAITFGFFELREQRVRQSEHPLQRAVAPRSDGNEQFLFGTR